MSNSGNAISICEFDIDDYPPIVFHTFYLSSSTVSYANYKLRVKSNSIRSKMSSRPRKYSKKFPHKITTQYRSR